MSFLHQNPEMFLHVTKLKTQKAFLAYEAHTHWNHYLSDHNS